MDGKNSKDGYRIMQILEMGNPQPSAKSLFIDSVQFRD
jgi:hypothetical protein